MKNLLNFRATSVAKISTYKFFASELLSNNERQVITRAFKSLDKEGDGELGTGEILKGCEICGLHSVTEYQIQNVFNQINLARRDKSKITYSQFCMAAINENVLVNKEKSRRAFNLFDTVRI